MILPVTERGVRVATDELLDQSLRDGQGIVPRNSFFFPVSPNTLWVQRRHWLLPLSLPDILGWDVS